MCIHTYVYIYIYIYISASGGAVYTIASATCYHGYDVLLLVLSFLFTYVSSLLYYLHLISCFMFYVYILLE